MNGEGAAGPELRICADASSLAATAADLFLERVRSASGLSRVVLSGGSTPRALYELLASRQRRDPAFRSVDWRAVHFFWGDERHVPPDHPDSNYGMARSVLLSALPLPDGNVHRIRGELRDAAAAAAEYETELRTHFALLPGAFPRFDLVLLGLGADGHTASLFPETGALEEMSRLVVANPVEKLGVERITLTSPVFNEASCVAFLVSGGGKADVLQRVLEGPRDPLRLPAQLIRPREGRLLWIVDPAAAAGLSRNRDAPTRASP